LKRVLVVYYSFTQQTRLLLKRFRAGLEQEGVEVVLERLEPLKPYEIPFRSNVRLASVMIRTFFRERTRVHPVGENCSGPWDHIVLAGPTWSYHPSGPMLDFLDRFGNTICGGQDVTVFISCRSYWRIHDWSMKRALKKFGAKISDSIVYEHPIREPFRLMGLVLQLRGKMIRRENSWFRKHYPGYGHNKIQFEDSFDAGVRMAKDLNSNQE
jgi:hypothetical protein